MTRTATVHADLPADPGIAWLGAAPPYKKPDGPSPREQMAELIEEGNFEGILRQIETNCPVLLDLKDTYRLLPLALERAVAKDPAAFAQRVLGKLAAFCANVALRNQMRFERFLRDHDPADISAEVSEHLVQGQLAPYREAALLAVELLRGMASIARQWKLCKRKRLRKVALNGALRCSLPIQSGNGNGRHEES